MDLMRMLNMFYAASAALLMGHSMPGGDYDVHCHKESDPLFDSPSNKIGVYDFNTYEMKSFFDIGSDGTLDVILDTRLRDIGIYAVLR